MIGKRLVAEYDTSGDGKLNFAEFCRLVTAFRGGKGKSMFDAFVPDFTVKMKNDGK